MRAQASRRGRGRPSKTDRPDGSSRQELVDAAAEVFAEQGYDAASVDQVIGRAGLSKGTFYFNFASKEDLFLAVIDDRVDRPAREVMELTAHAPADTPTSADVSAGLAAILSNERPLLMLLQDYWRRAANDEALATRYRNRQAGLRSALAYTLEARHQQTGVPLTINASRLAEAFIALAQGLAFEAVVDRNAVDDALFGDIIALVYDGLVARANAEPGHASPTHPRRPRRT